MIDHDNLVGKLRDIHPPLSDSLTVLTAMTLFGGFCGIAIAVSIRFGRSKKKSIYVQSLERLIQSRQYPAKERIAIQAGILREIAMSLDPGAGFLRGEEWLSRLDSILQTNFFTRGPGRVFGEELYRPFTPTTANTLDQELSLILARFTNVRN